jgi:peptidoglycan biosynthesis protein MviN/MurJ (putative lipid II flippase)
LNLVLGILCGVIVILDVLILLFTRQFLELTTSQQIMQNFANKGLLDDYVKITQIMLLFPLGLAVQSIFGVFLTLKKRFFVYSWAGIIYNAGTILGILLSGYNGLYQVAWGMILGMWATVLVYAISSYQAGLKLVWTWGSTSKLWQNCQQDLVDTWKTFIPRIFVFNGVLTAGFLINLIATNNGQITYFDIGLSIQEVFLTISSSIATVFFPDLAKLWNRADLDREVFWNKLNKYVRIVTLVSMGGVVVTLILSPVVVRIFEILGKGQNNGDYIIMIARFSTLSLVFQSVNEILSKYFYVRERVWQPVILSLGGSVAQILLTMSLLLTGLDAGIITCLGLAANNLVIWLWSFYLIHQDRKVS